MLERMWRKGILVHCWWECRLVRPLWKRVWNFLRKIKIELPFDPAILLLGLYPKAPEIPIQKSLCNPMFLAAQFTIAKYWKQPKCPSADEWIKKLWAENQDGGIGRNTAPPRTTRTDRKSNGKGVRHQGNKK